MSKTQKRITPENVGSIASSSKDKKEAKKPVESPFVCEVCGRSFKSKAGLASHMKTHKEVIAEPIEEEPVEIPQEEEEIDEESIKWVTQYVRGIINNKPLIRQLSQERKITLILPKADSEGGSAVMEAKINGQAFEYPKGVYIDVPESMAVLLKSSVEAEESMGNESLSNRSEEVRKILS